MSKYRILEKRGYYERRECASTHCCAEFTGTEDGCNECSKYVPRFIVQEQRFMSDGTPRTDKYHDNLYKDLEEFTSLEDARAYKHELELEDGIVRE